MDDDRKKKSAALRAALARYRPGQRTVDRQRSEPDDGAAGTELEVASRVQLKCLKAMPQDRGDNEIDAEGGSDHADVGESPDQPRSDAAQASTDTQQTAQIQKLNRRVLFALVGAALGPLIAILGLVVSGLQWKAAEAQLAAMRVQIADSRDATRLEHRAWIFVTGADIDPNAVRITVRNMGRTPAINITALGTTTPGEPPLLEAWGGALPPGETRQYEYPASTPWNSDTSMVQGRIEYDDVFGSSHFTRFCYGVGAEAKRLFLARCSDQNTGDHDKEPTTTTP